MADGGKRTDEHDEDLEDLEEQPDVEEVEDWELHDLPEPTPDHLAALDAVIENTYQKQGLGTDEIARRERILHKLQEYLKPKIEDIQLRMCGSTLSGFGLKSSDLNIFLLAPSGCNHPHRLAQVYRLLCESDEFHDVRSHFTYTVPSVVCTHDGVTCTITLKSSVYYVSRYLKVYASMDPRVSKLAVALRYWAKICQVDVRDQGYMSGWALDMMTVNFLQSCQGPVLPLVWRNLTPEGLERSEHIVEMLDELEELTWTSRNRTSVGRLWMDMLLYYGLSPGLNENIVAIGGPRPESNWRPQKGVAFEKPFTFKRYYKIFLTNPSAFDYFYNSIRIACVYFGNPTSDSFHSDESSESSASGSDEEEEKQYNYEFSKDTLTDGTAPVMVCKICDKTGHLMNNCPDEDLPPMADLPKASSKTKNHFKTLSTALKQKAGVVSMPDADARKRQNLVHELQRYLRKTFPDIELTLFGSSENGFGLRQSDLDICATFRDQSPEDIDCVSYIQDISDALKRHRGLDGVYTIKSAKVPLVKFKQRNSKLEGDISLYNLLAQQNTRLLLTYSRIDERVCTLVRVVKVVARVCGIGDASRGGLSSYAYTLMMLHYLQHTSPPVIPVLQELGTEDDRDSQWTIEGWNAWFYEDLDNLEKVWPGLGQNQKTAGELWLGFFRYYTETFKFEEHVVTIRQFEYLTKFEKSWNWSGSSGKCIAIEDPFKHSHNLGSTLHRKMNFFILRTLVYAREVYGTPTPKLPDGCKSYQDYFFAKDRLTDGNPPKICQHCHKLGHDIRDCKAKQARNKQHGHTGRANKI